MRPCSPPMGILAGLTIVLTLTYHQPVLAAHSSKNFFPMRRVALPDEKLHHGIVYNSSLLLEKPLPIEVDPVPLPSTFPSMDPFQVDPETTLPPPPPSPPPSPKSPLATLSKLEKKPLYDMEPSREPSEAPEFEWLSRVEMEEPSESVPPSDVPEFDVEKEWPLRVEMEEPSESVPPSDVPEFDVEKEWSLRVEMEEPTASFDPADVL